MTLIRALPVLLVLGLGTGCQGFGTLGLKKNNDVTGQEATAKLEANRPAGEKLPEIVALPPAPPPAITPAPAAVVPPPAPAFTATTAKASSKGDTTAMAGASFDDEETTIPAPRKRSTAPKKGEKSERGEKIAAKPAGPHAKTYVVQRGDTLQKISQKFYGTTKNWQKIFEANKAKMKKPDVVIAGMVLQIP